MDLRQAAPVAYTPKYLAEKILRHRDAFEGERKQVTVLFADVSGFTAMSERLDPEEVHAIMDRAFDVMLDAVHVYEGTVNQFLGDGVMALFGAPIAHEDHAHRALRAALAIQDGLVPLKRDILRRHGLKFRVRMGINTGPVVVGAIGRDLRMDYTAVGDTTNLAARLLSVAGPGQIVVSRGTRRPAEDYFTFEDLGEFTLKGKSEPVPAYAVTGEIRGRTRLEVSRARGLTPLVGREHDLRRLTDAYQRVATGDGAVVLVLGEPGVGKSRVLYEFLHRIEGSGPTELEGTCLSHGRSMPFHPILPVFRQYLELTDDLDATAIRQRIGLRLAGLGLEGDEPVTLLAHFLGVVAPEDFLLRLGGSQLKERTLALLRDVLLRASGLAPVVLVVENLHWVDASSEEFLKALAAQAGSHHLLLLVSARPDGAPAWLAPPMAETIRLEGLGADEVRAMIRKLLTAREVAEGLVEVLLEKGEGNPLYVEEWLRQLQDTGGIVVDDAGTARLGAAHVSLPRSIHDIIAARIDRLSESVKHALQVAAVVGREFPVSLLARALEEGDTLAVALDDLRARDFIFPKAEEPERVYSFKHAVTQEVAYESLLERRRRLYHASVAAALEEIHAGGLDDIVELLAHHYGRSGDDEKAVDYAIRAAEKAQRRWANMEALTLFEGALGRLRSMEDAPANRLRRIDAVVKQSEIKFALGQHAEHVEALETIRPLVDAAADPPRRAAWYCWTGFLHSLTGGRPEVPLAYCREASAIAEINGLDEIRGIADCCLTHVSVVAGQLREALAAGERALGIFEARGNVWWTCRTLWGLSMAANASGEWGRSLEYCRRGLELGRAANDLRLKVVGWWRTGSTYVQQGIPKAGLRCCDEALALSPIPFDGAMVKAIRGYAQVKAGETAGAAALGEVLAWLDQSQLRYTRCVIGLLLAEAYLRQEEPARASDLVIGILSGCREFGYRHLEGVAERLLGEALCREDPVAAAQHLSRAQGIAEEVGARNESAKAQAARAELLMRGGDRAKALALLEQSRALFEALGTIDELARTDAIVAVFRSAPDSATPEDP